MQTFSNTKEALQEWHAGQSWRDSTYDAIWKSENIMAAFEKWKDACDLAEEAVREAFYEDTKAYNNWEHCKLVSVHDIRQIVGDLPSPAHYTAPMEQRL